MQGLQLEEQRSEAPSQPALLAAFGAETAALLGTLEYLVRLKEHLRRAAASAPSPPLDGANPALIRVRRARQAAAIQGALNVLRELAREQRLALPSTSDE